MIYIIQKVIIKYRKKYIEKLEKYKKIYIIFYRSVGVKTRIPMIIYIKNRKI